MQIARLYAEENLTNEELAEELGISPRTVREHIDRIKDVLGIEHKRRIRTALKQRGLL